MTTAVALKREQARTITRPLKVLIPLIQADLEQGDRAGMAYCADAGDKLIEAKAQVSHGHWGPWLSKNFHLVDRQAQRYMRVARLRAEHAEKRHGESFLPRSIHEMESDTPRSRARQKGEREFRAALRDVEADSYTQEEQTRQDEVQLHRELALELIDVGFKALATRLHPDRGGTKEAMARLNVVRDELKAVATKRRFV